MVGRFSAIMEDFDTLDWAYEELKNISQKYRKIKLERAAKEFYDGQRISSLFDMLYLLDERILLSSKLDLLDEKYKTFGGVDSLSTKEYIWFCNAKLDVFIRADKYAKAEKSILTCSVK